MNRGALAATNTATNSEGPSHSFDFLNRRRTCLLARWSEYPARITYDVQGMGQTAPRNLARRLPLPLGKLLRRPARRGMGSEYRNRLGQRTPARPSPHVGHRTSIGPLVLSGVQRSPRALAQGAGRDRVWPTDHHAGVRRRVMGPGRAIRTGTRPGRPDAGVSPEASLGTGYPIGGRARPNLRHRASLARPCPVVVAPNRDWGKSGFNRRFRCG